MNSNYHTSDVLPQSLTAGAGASESLTVRFVAPRHSTKPLRFPDAIPLAHPVLVGDRETLRKLRAAEMAAWESVRPKTTVEQTGPDPMRPKLWRLAANRSELGENLSFLVMAVCAGAASFAGFGDMSELINRWSLFVQAIRNLLE